MSKGSCGFIVKYLQDGAWSTVLVDQDAFVIGRALECEVTINDLDISRTHLEVLFKEGHVWIRDLGSSNGTFVDGKKLVPKSLVRLEKETEFRLGLKIALHLTAIPSVAKKKVIEANPQLNRMEKKNIQQIADLAYQNAEEILKNAKIQADERIQASLIKSKELETQAQEKYESVLNEAQGEVRRLLEDAERTKQAIITDAQNQVREEVEKLKSTQLHALEEHRSRIVAENSQLLEETREKAEDLKRTHLEEMERLATERQDALLQQAQEKIKSDRQTFEQELAFEREEQIQLLQKDLQNLRMKAEQETQERILAVERELQDKHNQFAGEHTSIKKELDRLVTELERAQNEILERTEKKIALEKQLEDLLLAIQNQSDRVSTIEQERKKQEQEFEKEQQKISESLAHRLKIGTEEIEKQLSQEKEAWENLLSQRKETLEKEIDQLQASFAADLKERRREMAAEQAQAAQLILDAKIQRDMIAAENDELEKNRKHLLEEGARLSFQVQEIENKLKDIRSAAEAEELELKTKIKDEYHGYREREKQSFEAMKLENLQRLKEIQETYQVELYRQRDRVVREIMGQMQSAMGESAHLMSDKWDETHEKLIDIMELKSSNLSQNIDTETHDYQKKHGAWKRKNLAYGFVSATCIWMLVWFGVQNFQQWTKSLSPEQAMALQKAQIEKEKEFIPQTLPDLRDNYVDSVIYTEGFVEAYLSEEYQKKWTAEMSIIFLRKWKVPEEKFIEVQANINALIKGLAESKKDIDARFLKQSLAQLHAQEESTILQAEEDLGSPIRWQDYKKNERRFYEAWQMNRVPAASE